MTGTLRTTVAVRICTVQMLASRKPTVQPTVIDIPVEYKPLFDTWWREAAVYGGRYSLKSHTVATSYLIKARQSKRRILCCREFQNSINDSVHQLLADKIKQYNFTEFKVTDKSIENTRNGSEFFFKGLHNNEQSIKSIEGLTDAWVEEAQTVSESSLEILTPTVRLPGSQIIYTYNRLKEDDPVHRRLIVEGRPNTLVLNFNYDLAEKYGWLPDVIKNEIEDDKKFRPGLYKHKWLGEPNSVEGKVYRDWAFIEEVPHEAELVRRGLDFGFTNDPTAIIDLYRYNGGYIVAQRLYRKGMHNNEIAEFLKSIDRPGTTVMADSSEPKSISEISQYGIPIIGVDKKGDGKQTYLKFSIDYLQQQRLSVTRASKELIEEYENYYWMQDKNGRFINEPESGRDHALDAVRYAFDGLRPVNHQSYTQPDFNYDLSL